MVRAAFPTFTKKTKLFFSSFQSSIWLNKVYFKTNLGGKKRTTLQIECCQQGWKHCACAFSILFLLQKAQLKTQLSLFFFFLILKTVDSLNSLKVPNFKTQSKWTGLTFFWNLRFWQNNNDKKHKTVTLSKVRTFMDVG